MSNTELKIIGFTNPNECLAKNTYNNMSAYVRFLHLDNKKTRLVVQSMNDRHTLNGSSNFIINNFMKFYRSPDSNRVDGNVFITLNTFVYEEFVDTGMSDNNEIFYKINFPAVICIYERRQ